MNSNHKQSVQTIKSYLQVCNVNKIRKAGNGRIFRHITLLDTKNQKTVDYVIFKDKDDVMWSNILTKNLDEIVYSGEILSFKVTKKILDEIISQSELTIKEGDIIDVVLWDDDGWDPLDIENRVRNSLQKQIWRFR